MKAVIELAREAGLIVATGLNVGPGTAISIPMNSWGVEEIKRLVELACADERERIIAANATEIEKINTHIKALEAAVLAEREACAKVAEDSDHVVSGRGYYDQLGDADATVRNIATAIRARSNT